MKKQFLAFLITVSLAAGALALRRYRQPLD